MKQPLIAVVLAYAGRDHQVLRRLELAPGSTLMEAISISGVLRDFPEIDLARNRVGIFGRLARLDAPLREGDRVEIYRPLTADPKEARRRRADSRRKAR